MAAAWYYGVTPPYDSAGGVAAYHVPRLIPDDTVSNMALASELFDDSDDENVNDAETLAASYRGIVNKQTARRRRDSVVLRRSDRRRVPARAFRGSRVPLRPRLREGKGTCGGSEHRRHNDGDMSGGRNAEHAVQDCRAGGRMQNIERAYSIAHNERRRRSHTRRLPRVPRRSGERTIDLSLPYKIQGPAGYYI